jgi:Bacterial Ig domain
MTIFKNLPRSLRVVVSGLFLLVGASALSASGLQVTYSANGVQRLLYNGVVLEDLSQYPADIFHIWHMKVTDLKGNLTASNWGESNNGRSYNTGTNTWKYLYSWGSVSVQFVQSGDTLNMNVTAVNLAGSGVIFDGANIYPLVLHFPQLPAGFGNAAYEQLAFNTTGPSVTVADFGKGEVADAFANAAKPLYTGYQPAGPANAYYPIISGTAIDNMATFFPVNDRPVMPGQTDSFTVSLRFAPSGTSISTLAADVYQNWAATWPAQLNWSDRRIIGTAYLASSPNSSNINQPDGYPNNPRRYFNDSNASDFDVRTAAGLAKFQALVLSQAQKDVSNLAQLKAQGVITWDIEGEQYPQNTSYVCSPNQIAAAAPEMDSVIASSASPYHGMKLDDAYFKIIRDAGYRVGVCVRPQHFAINANATAAQTFLANSQVEAEMLAKMQYAHNRWGVTLFYVDSAVDANGGTLSPSIFQALSAALPDSLIMPEESTPKFYAYTAPFQTFIYHTDLGTSADVYNYYPKAFSVNLVNDVDPGLLAQYRPQLTESVRRGDILMVHADYWQANNPTVVQMYVDAGVTPHTTPPPPPIPPTPTPAPPAPPAPAPPTPTTYPIALTYPTSGQTISGTVTVAASIPSPLDAAGTYLLVDGKELTTSHTTTYPYVYSLNTTLFSAGTHTLQAWAHDLNNDVLLSAPVPVVISNSTTTPAPTPPAPTPPAPSYPITLTYPTAGQAISGVVTVTSVIPFPLDSAGTYLMVDGKPQLSTATTTYPYVYSLDTALFSTGTHTLQLWAHDINNDALLSAPVTVTFAAAP